MSCIGFPQKKRNTTNSKIESEEPALIYCCAANPENKGAVLPNLLSPRIVTTPGYTSDTSDEPTTPRSYVVTECVSPPSIKKQYRQCVQQRRIKRGPQCLGPISLEGALERSNFLSQMEAPLVCLGGGPRWEGSKK